MYIDVIYTHPELASVGKHEEALSRARRLSKAESESKAKLIPDVSTPSGEKPKVTKAREGLRKLGYDFVDGKLRQFDEATNSSTDEKFEFQNQVNTYD